MEPRLLAVRVGLARGWIEFRHNVGQVFNYVFFPLIALIVIYFVVGNEPSSSGISIGLRTMPGILAVNVVFTGLMGLAITLIMERDDGTLLRAKTTPNDVLGYLIGKVASQTALSVTTVVIVLIPAAFLFDGLQLGSVASWLTLIWVLMLGLVATLPFGAILGSLFTSPRNIRFVTLLLMGLVAISGVFSPAGALPQWVEWIGQIFPLYWLSLGMRSAMLPPELVENEIAASWRHMETLSVLGVWAIIGLAVAPAVLRHMARRQAGSKTRLALRGKDAKKYVA